MKPKDALNFIRQANGETSKTQVAAAINALKCVEIEIAMGVHAEVIHRGDVFWGSMVGGKNRPWIALRVADEIVCAVAMSSGDKAPKMAKSQCRLWPGNWIGSTVTLFPLDDARMCVLKPYTNLSHLAEVERDLASLYGMSGIVDYGECFDKSVEAA